MQCWEAQAAGKAADNQSDQSLFTLFPGDIQWGETWATGSWRMDQEG